MSTNQEQSAKRPVLEMRNVSKSFSKKRVVEGFNMSVMPGEFVAITGKSGAGKSTLLNIIGLLDRADKGGSMALFGSPAPSINSPKARALLRNRLGYIFQNASLIDQDTVEANLKLAQRFTRTPRAKRAGERKTALLLVGLEGMEKQRVYRLSGGEQQRLAVACLLMHPSELVLADEPTGSLDAENRDVVMTLLHSLRNRGKTIIVVTHDAVVAATADRVVAL
jgi:putative ABC transport system ATP-binding protein